MYASHTGGALEELLTQLLVTGYTFSVRCLVTIIFLFLFYTCRLKFFARSMCDCICILNWRQAQVLVAPLAVQKKNTVSMTASAARMPVKRQEMGFKQCGQDKLTERQKSVL